MSEPKSGRSYVEVYGPDNPVVQWLLDHEPSVALLPHGILATSMPEEPKACPSKCELGVVKCENCDGEGTVTCHECDGEGEWECEEDHAGGTP